MQTNDELVSSLTDLPEHVQRNRAVWDKWASDYAAAR